VDVRAYAGSDVGRVREGNEDSAFAGRTAFAVADGMGGHVAGEVASETALQPIRELDTITFRNDKAARQALVDAIATANRTVVEKAGSDPAFRGMGTTLTAAVVRDGKLHVAHVGDSRAYLLRRNGELTQLTTDHTLVEQLIREGRLSREEAATHPQRSVITRAIGIEDDVQVDALPSLSLQPGDQVLLCSDGLTGPVSDAEITRVLMTVADGDAACQALIDAANAAGGPDNITVVLLRVEGPASRDAAAPAPEETVEASTPTEQFTRVTGAAVPAAAPSGEQEITRIRTRQESGRDWATSMRDYGAQQGADRRSVRGSDGGRRGLRILAGMLGVLVIGGLLAGGAVLLLSRAWFVGDDGGNVAVFRGLPSEVAGVSLARVETSTDIPLDDLTPRRAERIRQGVTFGSEAEARSFLEALRDELAEDDKDAGDAEQPAPTAPDPAAPSPPADPGAPPAPTPPTP